MPDDAMLSVGSVHGRGNVYKQIYCSGVASLLQLMQGCVIPISSIILPQIQSSNSEFSITKDQGSWFASFLCLGFLTGAVVGWIQSEYFGRKKSLMIDGFIATGGILIISFTRSYPLLIFARFLCGHASGSGTVSIPIYCSEDTLLPQFLEHLFLGDWLQPWLQFFQLYPSFYYAFAQSLQGSESAAEEEKQTIMASLLWQNKDNQACGTRSAKIQQCIKRIQSPSFWKPFLIIFFMLVVLTEWSGLPLIAFYMIDILGEWGISHIEIIKWIPAFGLAMLYCSASAGYVQITYSIQGELFPSDTRALGGGAIGICDGISLFLSTKAGPSIIEILDISGFFLH
ncbi:unnamed protein product [Lepeophtheirus salmonis]|uniref:(salmon louse) hypothetical protein n=1 Tax=Lepeophtheirus salmonis TaxID=72036 RepID=A0A7R8CBW8_LEPSM|nr:unnamed protein product [Lepeophtheirus salmonis]CAF2757261.1 unnamed protein product [Lepeophtheirus salmonis]